MSEQIADYVVDASVVIQRLIRDMYTPHARALFDGLDDLTRVHVPEFCLLECTNVLWKEVRFRGMPPTTAKLLIGDLRALPLNVADITVVLERALEIGLQHQLAVYDSAYIALAEHLAYPFVTVDARQEQAARAVGVTLKPVTDFV
jgi:predicted nucleic acid-binding protein